MYVCSLCTRKLYSVNFDQNFNSKIVYRDKKEV